MLRKHEAKDIIRPIMEKYGVSAGHWDICGNSLNIGVPDIVGMKIRQFKISYRSTPKKVAEAVEEVVSKLRG